ncbi:MAG: phosphoribosyltransferase [Alphaproteobacteria bacterium]|nr:phosphoribosyltransferase [Alphaproteobacteria bacterium]
MRFADRSEAGRLLAARLLAARLPSQEARRPVVLALPRGGVPVGFEVARALNAPLDLLLVRKIGAPHQPELAIGAIADGEAPVLETDSELIERLHIPPAYVERTKQAELAELERRRRAYLGDQAPIDLHGRAAIVVDDGIATGATMRAALRSVRRRGPAALILAVPVAPPDTLARMRAEVDEVVCLEAPEDFMAVGQFYRDFPQLDDAEVTALLARARAEKGGR